MRLKRDASEKELTDVAALEAYTTHTMLEKGGVSLQRRIFFMVKLAEAAVSLAEELAPPTPKRTRKPRKHAS